MAEYNLPNEVELSKFFERERKRTVTLLKSRFSFSHEDAEDIYQDACVALYQNIQGGKLITLSAKLSSYFLTICVNQSLKKKRDSVFLEPIDGAQYDEEKVDELLKATRVSNISERKVVMLQNILKQLRPPCNVILWCYYGLEMKMEDIAEEVDYSNGKAVKSKKWQCLQQLDTVITDKLKTEYYDDEDY